MLVELVSLLNDDGLRLDGAFYPPTEGADRAGPVDAVLLIHGSRGNFYDGATKSMAEDLSTQGYACLPLNTNAHDTAWYNPGSREFKGNAFEVLADTCIDLRAGIDHLTERGYRSIGLLGHSMGAVRVAYYAATQDDGRVATVVPVSPVRLSYSYFMEGTPEQIIKNSVCDACAQATEGYDSKLGNDLTRTLCKQAFDVLYDAIMNDKPENYPYGSMISGMGFGNCSTTLGHALSYVFSNEGVAHGYSLSSCTTIAHKHNNSIFYEKFKQVIEKLGFDKMELKAPVDEAADVVMTDKGHLNPNPIPISKEDVIKCLNAINDGNL